MYSAISPRKTARSDFRKRILLLALVSCYGGASLLMFTHGFEQLSAVGSAIRFVLVGGGLVLLIPLTFTAKNRPEFRGGASVILFGWLFFGLASVAAAVAVNDSIYSTLTECWLFLGVPLFFFYLFPRSEAGYSHRANLYAIVLVTTGYLLYTFYQDPDLKFLYRGVFGHPNQVGLLGSLLGVGCISILLFSSRTGLQCSKLAKVALYALLLLGISTVLLSGSRTALLAFLVTTCTSVIFMRKRPRRLVLTAAALFAFGMAFFMTDTYTGIGWVDAFIQKHQTKSQSGETLSGRETIWAMILSDATVTGHGSEYFANNIGISAHNSFLHVLGRRGMIAFVMIGFFCLISITKTFGYVRRISPRDPTAAGSLLLIIHFWCLSMAEATLGNIGTIVSLSFYAAVGALLVGPVQSRIAQIKQPVYRFHPVQPQRGVLTHRV